jgi:hypothetical protein
MSPPPQEVGSRALPILLGVLQEDAPEDIETAKAVVETLSLLCEVEEVDGRVSLTNKQHVHSSLTLEPTIERSR